MIARIRAEAQVRSQVAATFNHLTNVTGPRRVLAEDLQQNAIVLATFA